MDRLTRHRDSTLACDPTFGAGTSRVSHGVSPFSSELCRAAPPTVPVCLSPSFSRWISQLHLVAHTRLAFVQVHAIWTGRGIPKEEAPRGK